MRLSRRQLRPPPKSSDGLRQAAPELQSDSTLACSSAPHPSDPQPPNPNGLEAEIPTLLTADILVSFAPTRSFRKPEVMTSVGQWPTSANAHRTRLRDTSQRR